MLASGKFNSSRLRLNFNHWFKPVAGFVGASRQLETVYGSRTLKQTNNHTSFPRPGAIKDQTGWRVSGSAGIDLGITGQLGTSNSSFAALFVVTPMEFVYTNTLLSTRHDTSLNYGAPELAIGPDGHPNFSIIGSGIIYDGTSGPALKVGQTSCVIFTWSGVSGVRVFVDGKLHGTAGSQGFSLPTFTQCVLGKLAFDHTQRDDTIIHAFAWSKTANQLVSDALLLNLSASPRQLWKQPDIPAKAGIAGGSVYEVLVTDGMQFEDPTKKDAEHLLRDNMLLLDSALTEAGRIVVLALLDGVLFEEYLTRVLEHRMLDHALLGDIGQALSGIERTVADQVLLRSDRLSELDKILLEKVLIEDVVLKALEGALVLTDNLLLRDSSETLKGVIERLVLDGLLLAESLIRHEDKYLDDSLLLRDNDLREQLKTLVDYLLLNDALMVEKSAIERIGGDSVALADRFYTARELTVTEELMFFEVLHKLRELAATDEVGLLDAAAVSKIGYIIEFLTWARIRNQDMLGIRIYSRDPLGIKIDVSQWEMQT